MASIDISVRGVGLEADITKQYNSVQAQINRRPLQLKLDSSRFPLGRITSDVKDLDKSIGAATNRVVAFGLAAGVFTQLAGAFKNFIKSTVDVEDSLTRINVNLDQNADGLKRFSAEIFDIARNTGTTFEETAKAAEELARQGLSAEETATRLKDALILARIAGIDTAESVKALTSAVNTFAKEGLTTADIVNRFAAVDTRFAVSSKDLEQAIARVGNSAEEAGVSFNQLLGIVTAVQQSTQRGGATIGNSLKTIFTRISRPEALEQLQQLGIVTKDVNNNLLPGIQIIQNLASQYDKLSQGQKSFVAEQVGGVYQINILKAAVADLNKEYGTYSQVQRTLIDVTDAASIKNDKLNGTLKSLINSTQVSIKELFASLGNQSVGGAFKGILSELENFRKALTSSDIGQYFGESILKGVSNVLTGPVFVGLILALGKTVAKVFQNIGGDLQSAIGLNGIAEQRAKVEERISAIKAQATAAEQQQINAATSLLERKEAILRISERIAASEQRSAYQSAALAESFIAPSIIPGAKGKINPKLNFAEGFLPAAISKEQMAISKGVGGASPGAKPVVIPNFAFGNGKVGPVVANSDEYMVKNYASGGGAAILNPAMIKSIGLPPSASKIANAAGGLVPNMATGFSEKSGLRLQAGSVGDLGGGFFLPGEEIKKLNSLFKSVRDAGGTQAAFKFGEQIHELSDSLDNVSKKKVVDKLLSEFNKLAEIENRPKVIFASGGRKLSEKEFNANREAQTFRGDSRIASDLRRESSRSVNVNALNEAIKERDTLKRDQSFLGKTSNFLNKPAVGVGIAIAAPLAAGFIKEEQGGTFEGKRNGAFSGALQGAGIGGIFGPAGIAAGAVIGALVGGLSKATQSIQEFSKNIDATTDKNNKELNAFNQASNILSQIVDAKKNGAPQDSVDKLNQKYLEVRGEVSDPKLIAALGKSPEERNKIGNSVENTNKNTNKIGEAIKSIFTLSQKGALIGNSGFAGIDRSQTEEGQSARKSISSILTPEIVKTLDVKLLGRAANFSGSITGKQQINDAAAISKELEKISPELKGLAVNERNFNTIARVILKAAVDAKDKKPPKELEDANRTPAQQTLDKNAFTTKGDLTPFAQAGSSSRYANQFTTKYQKAQTQFDFFKALEAQGAYGEGELEKKPEYQVARATVRRGNALDSAASYLSGKIPGFVSNGANGALLETGIKETLDRQVRSNPNDFKAKEFQEIIQKLEQELFNLKAGIETKNKLNFNQGSINGITIGAPSIAYAGKQSASSNSFLYSSEKSAEDKRRAQDFFNGRGTRELGYQQLKLNDKVDSKQPIATFADSIDAFSKANTSASEQVTKALQAASDSFKNTKFEALNTFAVTVELAPDMAKFVTQEAMAEYAANLEAKLKTIMGEIKGKPVPPQPSSASKTNSSTQSFGYDAGYGILR